LQIVESEQKLGNACGEEQIRRNCIKTIKKLENEISEGKHLTRSLETRKVIADNCIKYENKRYEEILEELAKTEIGEIPKI
jgi:ribosomal protein L7Ae-like RNA K-turn-binding protein